MPWRFGRKSDAGGQFRLANILRCGLVAMNGVHVWAYRPGSGDHGDAELQTPFDLVLRKPQPRTVKLEGPDGRPIAGAVVSPRVISSEEARIAELPGTLAMPLAVTTGPDGQATIDCLAGER